MRRNVFLILGALELLAAGLLVVIGWRLPGTDEVRQSFGRAEQVSAGARTQVLYLRNDIETLRDRKVQQLVRQIEPLLPRIQARLEGQDLNLEAVRQASQSLDGLAKGMEAWANALDPAAVGALSEGVGRLADFLDGKVAPAAARSAERLEKSAEALRKDAKLLSELLREAPPDLRAAKEVYESLGRFDNGLEKVSLMLDPARLRTMREGFQGIETSLATGADQVARLASYTYPVVRFNGLRPIVEEKRFWPEGGKIAGGMRKGAAGVRAASKEMELVAKGLPELQKSLEESRAVVAQTRAMLGRALKDQEKLEAVLKAVPQTSARLAADLPALSDDLARVLRDTEQLTEVAKALRQTRKGMDAAVRTWPAVRQGLLDSSVRLTDLRKKIDAGLGNTDSYRDTLHRTADVMATLSDVLPLLTAHLEARLEYQQEGLTRLADGLGEVHHSLPAIADSTAGLLNLVRWLLWLIALIAAVHAAYLLTMARQPQPALQATSPRLPG